MGVLQSPCPGHRRHRWGCCRGPALGTAVSGGNVAEAAPPGTPGIGGDVAEEPCPGHCRHRWECRRGRAARHPWLRWGCCRGPAPGAAGTGGDAAEALPWALPAPVGVLQRPCPGHRQHRWECCRDLAAGRCRHRWGCCRGAQNGSLLAAPGQGTGRLCGGWRKKSALKNATLQMLTV